MRITIGLPFFNNAATLANAVRSVFAQTFDDWELVLVDDGSQDTSLEIARSIIDERVRVFSDGKNRELSYRLNQIAQLARSEFIARLDADDLMHPARLQRQVEYLEQNRDLDLVSTGMYAIDSANRPVGKRGCGPMSVRSNPLVRGQAIAHATVTGRASWFRANPYDPQYRRAQDYELWCRSFAEHRLCAEIVPEPLYFCREEGSVTLTKILGSYRAKRVILQRYGPSQVGWGPSRVMIGTVRAKEIVYRLAAMIGKEMMIVHRRNQPLDEQEKASASQTVQTVLNTVVPGLPEPGCRVVSACHGSRDY